MNMYKWMEGVKADPIKKPFPILSFPCVKLLDISVKELISDSDNQAKGMKAVADRIDSLAAVSYMDLSLEAEAFGADIKVTDDEVPTVIGCLVPDEDAAEALKVPTIEDGRIGIYLDGMKKALQLIEDRPVFAGIIGPFSLAGRLVDVNKAMLYCKKKPELLHTVLRKATDFLIKYAKAYKAVGAHGIVMAEPLSGLLSPRLEAKFSAPYVKEIAEALKSEDFLVMYHNCGNYTPKMIESISSNGCDAYHFGNAIDMAAFMEEWPEDLLAMGNIDPAEQFTNGTPESMKATTTELLEKCADRPNFLISSGCDIPPGAKWENIDAFFEAVNEFYDK